MALWSVKTQDRKGVVRDTGEPTQTSLYLAKNVARDLAYAERNTTFFVESDKGRVALVVHYVKEPVA